MAFSSMQPKRSLEEFLTQSTLSGHCNVRAVVGEAEHVYTASVLGRDYAARSWKTEG